MGNILKDACFVKGEKIVWWKSALQLAISPYFHGGWFGVLSKSIALQGIWHRNWCCYCSGVKPGEIGPRVREPSLQKATHFTLENSIRHVGTSASMAAMAYLCIFHMTARPHLPGAWAAALRLNQVQLWEQATCWAERLRFCLPSSIDCPGTKKNNSTVGIVYFLGAMI